MGLAAGAHDLGIVDRRRRLPVADERRSRLRGDGDLMGDGAN
jgi:hypothetical protein